MRTITGLFIVGVALFVCGIGFIVAGARTLRQSTLVAQPVITTPVASIKQIMNGITGPAATAIYTAVGTVINADGVKDIAPETDEDWAALADKAAALVESGNLLLMGSRALDNDIFIAYQSPQLAQIPDSLELDSQHRALPVDFGDVCLNYDKAWFATNNMEPPQTLEQLAEPHYASLTVVENPATSSPGLAFLLATISHFGEDGYVAFCSKWPITVSPSLRVGKMPITVTLPLLPMVIAPSSSAMPAARLPKSSSPPRL